MCFYHEPCEIYQSEIRTARKPHTCAACSRTIERGQLYEYGHGVFDGRGFATKLCGACCLLAKRLHDQELSEGCHWAESWPNVGDLREIVEQLPDELPSVEEGQEHLRHQREQEKARAT